MATVPRVTLAGPPTWLTDSHTLNQFASASSAPLAEDEVKAAIKLTLDADGWRTEVRWGYTRGIDIEAIHGDERFVLEAKGEGKSDQERTSFFDGALGELMRRMNSSDARYGLALPAHRAFVGHVTRLPLWIRQRLNLWFFIVRRAENGIEVGIFPPDGRSTLH